MLIGTIWNQRFYTLHEAKFFLSRVLFYRIFNLLALFSSAFSSRVALKLSLSSLRCKFNESSARRVKSLYKSVSLYGSFEPTRKKLSEKILTRMIVLASPINDGRYTTRKGVLLIKFSETIEHLLKQDLFGSLAEKYYIVIEPSWSGYALPQFVEVARLATDPVFILSAEKEDRLFLDHLDSHLIPVQLGSGSWVDFEKFSNFDQPYDYDYILVANYNPVKRVNRFLKEAAKLKSKPFKFALACAKHGSENQEIVDYITNKASLSNVVFLGGLSQTELVQALNRSKICVLYSLKEGSNRSLFEASATGCKIALTDRNVGVDKDLFQGEHAFLFKEGRLVETTGEVQSNRDATRDWAKKHVHPEVSTQQLLSAINLEVGDLFEANDFNTKCNNPELSFYGISEYTKQESDREIFECLAHRMH